MKYFTSLIDNNHIIGVSFIITSTKLYVPVFTLKINGNINIFNRKYKARI